MVDVNTLVKPGSTPLYLIFGNDINSRGEIATYAFSMQEPANSALPWRFRRARSTLTTKPAMKILKSQPPPPNTPAATDTKPADQVAVKR